MRITLFYGLFARWMPAFAGMTRRMALMTLRIALTLSLPSLAMAAYWPSFKAPDLTFLQNNNMIDTSNCPAGEGRITPKLALNIQQHFCKRVCPSTWEWILSDNGQCHPLADSFTFQRYEFEYFKNGEYEDEKLYTKVTALYGSPTDNKSTFTFTFTSEKDNHWQCSEMSPEYHTVICANDMLRG